MLAEKILVISICHSSVAKAVRNIPLQTVLVSMYTFLPIFDDIKVDLGQLFSGQVFVGCGTIEREGV